MSTLVDQPVHIAWDLRNVCKHSGAVLPLVAAPEGRGADGLMLWLDGMMMMMMNQCT
jgi:hypothetical protein